MSLPCRHFSNVWFPLEPLCCTAAQQTNRARERAPSSPPEMRNDGGRVSGTQPISTWAQILSPPRQFLPLDWKTGRWTANLPHASPRISRSARHIVDQFVSMKLSCFICPCVMILSCTGPSQWSSLARNGPIHNDPTVTGMSTASRPKAVSILSMETICGC